MTYGKLTLHFEPQELVKFAGDVSSLCAQNKHVENETHVPVATRGDRTFIIEDGHDSCLQCRQLMLCRQVPIETVDIADMHHISRLRPKERRCRQPTVP